MEVLKIAPFEQKTGELPPKVNYSTTGALEYIENILEKAGTIKRFDRKPGRLEQLAAKITGNDPITEKVSIKFDSSATSVHPNGTTTDDTRSVAYRIFGEVADPEIIIEAIKNIDDVRYEKCKVTVLTNGAMNTESPLGISLTFHETPDRELKAEAELVQRNKRPYRKPLDLALRGEFSSRFQAIIKYLGHISNVLDDFDTEIPLPYDHKPEIRIDSKTILAAKNLLVSNNAQVVWKAK